MQLLVLVLPPWLEQGCSAHPSCRERGWLPAWSRALGRMLRVPPLIPRNKGPGSGGSAVTRKIR